MEDDQLDDDIQDTQRSVVIGAVLLAVLVSAVLWYVLIFRDRSKPGDDLAFVDSNVDVIELPAQPEEPTAVMEPVADTGANFVAESAVAGATAAPESTQAPTEMTPTPVADPTPITSETGPGTVALAAAAAASVVGAFGLRRIRS